MKNYWKRIVIGLTLAMGASAWAADEPAHEVYPWLGDLDQARAIAAEQRKPMLIAFRCVP